MKPRIPGTNPLAETRREANESVDRKTKYLQIIKFYRMLKRQCQLKK